MKPLNSRLTEIPEPPDPEEVTSHVDEKEAFKRINAFTGRIQRLPNFLSVSSDEDWIFEGLFCRGDLVILYGPAKSGKSFLALDMIMAAASGQDWCNGRFLTPKARTAMYCTGEGHRGLKRRYQALMSKHQPDAKTQSRIAIASLVPQLFSTDSLDSACKLIEAVDLDLDGQLDLLIIDTLNRASIGANENSAQDMSAVLSAVSMIQCETGSAVLLVHHSDKEGKSIRGSSVLRGAVDVAMKVQSAGKGHELICDAIKDGEYFEPLRFELLPVAGSVVVKWLGFDALGNANSYSAIILNYLESHSGDWCTAKEISESTEIGKNRTHEVLADLRTKGFVECLDHHPTKQIPRNPRVFRVVIDHKDIKCVDQSGNPFIKGYTGRNDSVPGQIPD